MPTLAAGWTRYYVLRGVGYCKDADPFTGTSDSVAPMPWKGMADDPFDRSAARPVDRAYQRYLDTYQTRASESR